MNESSGRKRPQIPSKVATGIRGLDEILVGGLPQGRTSLVRGGPGTGKTVLAFEFIYRGALAGEPGIFLSFEERADVLRENALSLGWDLEPLEREGLLEIIQPAVPIQLVETGDFDIQGLLSILNGKATELGTRRIVIDAADVFLRLFKSQSLREDQLFALHYWLWEQQSQTAMLTLKTSEQGSNFTNRLEYMADCVIHLDNRVAGQVSTRRLRVIKCRGSTFLSNEFPCVITEGGFVLMPISRSSLTRKQGGKVSTGNTNLDKLLEGGYLRGSCVLVGGSTGTGKTTFASQFAIAACKRQERVLYVGFEESLESLVSSMRSVSLNLAGAVDDQQLEINVSLPEAMGAEQHLWQLTKTIDRFCPQHVVVDAISACPRMGSEEAAFDFLVRLLTFCRSKAITCIFLNQIIPDHAPHSISGIGISSLVDTLILLEQYWSAGGHQRRLVIVKSRGTRHSHDYQHFHITDSGIELAASSASGRDINDSSSRGAES